MVNTKSVARPFVVTIKIPTEETAYIYIGANTPEAAKEAAQQMLDANSTTYKDATITQVEDYKPAEQDYSAPPVLN